MREAAVIGGGPGGYGAAIGLAQAGWTVRLIEADAVGGTCLHRGCIPTKTMLETARLARALARAGEFGLRLPPGEVRVDFQALRQRQAQVVARLVDGLRQLLAANGVEVVAGRGRLAAATAGVPRVVVEGDRRLELAPDAIVLAPGSRPAPPPLPGLDLPGVLDSDALLADSVQPARLVVIGAGVVGCEFACAYAALGTEVTLLEALPQVLPGADTDVARRLEAALRRQGIALHTGVRVQEIAAGLVVRGEGRQGAFAVEADRVLVATGRRAATDGLGLEEAGGQLRTGAIAVDPELRCQGLTGVWALGDAIGAPGLAHAAFLQAERVVASVAGRPLPPPSPVPHPVYTLPEVAWVGMDEVAARAAGLEPTVARTPNAALGRAVIAGEVDGFSKVVAADGRVVGVHLIGPHATELIGAATLAVAQRLPVSELAAIPLPHPTFSEGLGEAAALMLGLPRHLAPTRGGR